MTVPQRLQMRCYLGLVLCMLGASLPSAQAMSDGSFPGKGSKAVWNKASEIVKVGIQLGQAGKDREAIGLYQKAIGMYPFDSLFYYNTGIAYSDLKDYRKAEAFYRKAISLEPTYYSAWYNMGIDFYWQGNYRQSQTAIEKAQALAKTEKQKSDAAAYLKALKSKLK